MKKGDEVILITASSGTGRCIFKESPDNWTKEELEEYVKERLSGVQYFTGFGPVFCPPRNWESEKK